MLLERNINSYLSLLRLYHILWSILWSTGLQVKVQKNRPPPSPTFLASPASLTPSSPPAASCRRLVLALQVQEDQVGHSVVLSPLSLIDPLNKSEMNVITPDRLIPTRPLRVWWFYNQNKWLIVLQERMVFQYIFQYSRL